MKNFYSIRLVVLIAGMAISFLPAFSLPAPVFAAVPGQTTGELYSNLQKAGETGAGYSAKGRLNPLAYFTGIIKAVMGILGVLFLALTVYGGYIWMMARRNAERTLMEIM